MSYQWRQVDGFEEGTPNLSRLFNLVRDGKDVLSVNGHEKRAIDQLAEDLIAGGEFTTEVELFGGGKHVGDGVWEVEAPFGGEIYEVALREGDLVGQSKPVVVLHDQLLTLNQMVAPVDGTITRLRVRVGQKVETGDLLFQLRVA